MINCYDLKKTVVSLPPIGKTYLRTYIEGYGVLTYHTTYKKQYNLKTHKNEVTGVDVSSYFISLTSSLVYDVQDYQIVKFLNGDISVLGLDCGTELSNYDLARGVDEWGYPYYSRYLVRHDLHPVTIQFIVQLISRRVSGDDLVKGLRSHGFSRSVKLIQDVLGGWIVKLDGNRATIFDVIAELEHCVTTAE